jgi:two-component system cell cycle response regulator
MATTEHDSEPPPASRGASARGRVLVVGRRDDSGLVLRLRLGALGYDVHQVEGAARALEQLSKQSFDAVICEIGEASDAGALTTAIRGRKELGSLPILWLMAPGDEARKLVGLEAGADDFLARPVNPAELALRLRGHVRRRRLEFELARRASLLGASQAPNHAAAHVIWIVDGEEDHTQTNETLAPLGAELRFASTVEAAKTLLSTGLPSLVLLELALSDGSGVEVLRALRHEPGGWNVPVLVVTADDDLGAKLAALQLGAHDCVQKPVSSVELLVRARGELRRAEAQRRARVELETARSDAVIDPGTGLFNRRSLTRDLAERIRQGEGSMRGFSVILCDLDHFKRVNDTHGHLVGDEVLRSFARLVRKNVRESDMACRFGGEEFVIVLPDTPLSAARIAAEKLRSACERTTLCAALGPSVTASFGVAEWIRGQSPETLLTSADEALYRAKNGGRNRVEAAGT